jgi:hypothetical protein
LTYSEKPIKILDTVERVTCNKVIKMCKVQWSHHTKDEATWEQSRLSGIIPKRFLNLEGEITLRGVGL